MDHFITRSYNMVWWSGLIMYYSHCFSSVGGPGFVLFDLPTLNQNTGSKWQTYAKNWFTKL